MLRFSACTYQKLITGSVSNLKMPIASLTIEIVDLLELHFFCLKSGVGTIILVTVPDSFLL